MLYQKKIIPFLAVLFLVLLSGCSHRGEPQPVNELRFSLNGISDVTISYDEERITFFEAESDELVLREYMTENKAAYHAKVDQRGEYLHISEGGKPVFKESFNRYIEVYLPASYQGNLTVTTTDGNIDLSEVPLELSTLCVDSTSGRVEISQVSADSIKLSSTSGTIDIGQLNAKRIQLETTSGSISCDSVEGYVVYSSTSGDLEIKSAAGSGTYKANNSGELNVTYTMVDNDLYLFNKNDTVNLTLPADLEFRFTATTKNGSVSTTFPESISINGQITSGSVGLHPTVTIEVETRNGDIQVTQ